MIADNANKIKSKYSINFYVI